MASTFDEWWCDYCPVGVMTVELAERERCARVCDKLAGEWEGVLSAANAECDYEVAERAASRVATCKALAAAIRKGD